ncbi:hypothetical protein JTE90_006876 [Oedothorax gibbosus]|uniref:Secreted protein n=1 Tax=Oedothorax gibbosus TaxID=931172 RepID=A0AAV6TKU4_9ARAC|nr:hypothetical protein JTE90_006876 [Oedothorax gibbosus]
MTNIIGLFSVVLITSNILDKICSHDAIFHQVFLLRRLMQGDRSHPKTILANNFRPPQSLHNRSVRTNVFNHDIGVSSQK